MAEQRSGGERTRKDISQEVRTVQQQLIDINPKYREALELMVKAFTRSGGEALAQNRSYPDTPQKPNEMITVDELYNRLLKAHSSEADPNREVLLKFQEWYGTISELQQDTQSWDLLEKLVNLYHEQAGVKPVEPETLQLTLASTFLRGLKEKFGFVF